MSLQRTDANVQHVNYVVLVSEAGARLVAIAAERQVVVMPLAVFLAVRDVL